MNELSTRIGIIGGGQLGKMMILDAKRMGLSCVTLDPDPTCPSANISDELLTYAFDDADGFRKLAEMTDVLTYEFEHINADVLVELEQEGHIIYPSPQTLLKIQDKYIQKGILHEAGINVPKFVAVKSTHEIRSFMETYNTGVMLKCRTGGYDGKGNAPIRQMEDIPIAFDALGSGAQPLMIEAFIPFEKEISVLACRSPKGEVSIYPIGENHHKDSILDETIVPAIISEKAMEKGLHVAHQVMELFEGVGMFCIEMFVTSEDEVLVNEIAPRPHNSGHYTIEGCYTSQFEQHIRAIVGLPLGCSQLREPSVMKNMLGDEKGTGHALVSGMDRLPEGSRVKVHVYGKKLTKPKRKMGHITATASSVEEALQIVRETYDTVTFIAQTEGEDMV